MTEHVITQSESQFGVDASAGAQTDLREEDSPGNTGASAPVSVIGKPHVIRAILLHDMSHVQDKNKKIPHLHKQELPFQNLGLRPQMSERSTQAASSD